MKFQKSYLVPALLAVSIAAQATSVKIGSTKDGGISMKEYKVTVENQDNAIAAFLASNTDTLASDSKLVPLVDFLKGVGYEGTDRQVLTAFTADQSK